MMVFDSTPGHAGLPRARDSCRCSIGPAVEGPDQYESLEVTSPPLLVAIAHQTSTATEFLIPRTEPSANVVLTMPGCRLLAVMAPLVFVVEALIMHDQVFGGITWLYRELLGFPMCQTTPTGRAVPATTPGLRGSPLFLQAW